MRLQKGMWKYNPAIGYPSMNYSALLKSETTKVVNFLEKHNF